MDEIQKSVGVDLTFEQLLQSRRKNVSEVLCAAIEEPDATIQKKAILTSIKKNDRTSQLFIIKNLAHLQETSRERVIENSSEMLGALKDATATDDAQIRRNALVLLENIREPKIVFLLIPLLNDSDTTINNKASSLLKDIIEDFRKLQEDFKQGHAAITRDEYEGKKYALLDPLLNALKNANQKHKELIITALMGLDRRANEALINTFSNLFDKRGRTVEQIIWNNNSSEVVKFVVEMIRNEETSVKALEILERRDDLVFLERLVSCEELFNDPYILNELHNIENFMWLDYPPEAFNNLSTQTLINVLSLVMLTGIIQSKKAQFFKNLYGLDNPELRQFILAALKELSQGKHPQTIIAHLKSGKLSQTFPANLKNTRPLDTEDKPSTENDSGTNGSLSEHTGTLRDVNIPAQEPEITLSEGDKKFSVIHKNEKMLDEFFENINHYDYRHIRNTFKALQREGCDFNRRIKTNLAGSDADKKLKTLRLLFACHLEKFYQKELLNMLSEPNNEIRSAAIKIIARYRDESSIEAILRTITDSDARVTANSIEAIEQSGRKEMKSLVVPYLEHPNNRIKANAIKALWKMQDKSGWRALQKMLKSVDPSSRASAYWLLGEIDIPGRQQLLEKICSTEQNEKAKRMAQQSLERIAHHKNQETTNA